MFVLEHLLIGHSGFVNNHWFIPTALLLVNLALFLMNLESQEGHNAERFAGLYGSLPRIRVPKIYWEYT